jgi:galactokinase
VAVLQRHYPAVASLRDATLAQLAAHQAELGDLIYRRCRYVVQENERVALVCAALAAGDMATVGQLLYASHAGLRDDYQVSCPELDKLVALAQGAPGVLGARMMGGGFGGCTLNLVVAEKVTEFVAAMEAQFLSFYRRGLATYDTTIVAGVSTVHQPTLVA